MTQLCETGSRDKLNSSVHTGKGFYESTLTPTVLWEPKELHLMVKMTRKRSLMAVVWFETPQNLHP
jgi:hypothetical protein